MIDDDRADPLFVERLIDLVTHQSPRGRFLLLAFDKHYTQDGKPDLNATEFFTPNDYVLKIVDAHPELFLAAGSVHPYRADALDELVVDKLLAKDGKHRPSASECLEAIRSIRQGLSLAEMAKVDETGDSALSIKPEEGDVLDDDTNEKQAGRCLPLRRTTNTQNQ